MWCDTLLYGKMVTPVVLADTPILSHNYRFFCRENILNPLS